MVTTLLASLSACFCSAASALAAFFCASLAARFCASRDNDAVAASSASTVLCQPSVQEVTRRIWEERAGGGLALGPNTFIHVRVLLLQPLLAFLDGPAILAVLVDGAQCKHLLASKGFFEDRAGPIPPRGVKCRLGESSVSGCPDGGTRELRL